MRIILICVVCTLCVSCSRQNIIHPQRKDIVETVYASGNIISDSEYNLYALSSGTIIKKLVKDGDVVTKNQVLYIVKNDASAFRLQTAQTNLEIAQKNLSDHSSVINDLKLSLQNAQAKLTNDSSNYLHLKNLWDENIGTKNNLDAAYTQYIISKNELQSAHEKYNSALNDLTLSLHTAQSQLADAQNDFSNYYIRSQSNGTVFQTYKEDGENIKPNDVVAIIGKTAQRIIKLAVDQEDIDKIKTGQQVLLKTDITGDKIYHATITRLYPLMNEADQTFRVDAVFSDTTQQPFIHSSVEANIIIQKKNNVLVIPRAAMIADDSVQVKQNGKTKTVAVQTGISTLDETEIVKGLNESSEVILSNQ